MPGIAGNNVPKDWRQAYKLISDVICVTGAKFNSGKQRSYRRESWLDATVGVTAFKLKGIKWYTLQTFTRN